MNGGGTVQLLLFGGARECAGVGTVVIDLASNGETSVAALCEALLHRFPALVPARNALRFAVNGHYVPLEEKVRLGDEVAVIPPVAGG